MSILHSVISGCCCFMLESVVHKGWYDRTGVSHIHARSILNRAAADCINCLTTVHSPACTIGHAAFRSRGVNSNCAPYVLVLIITCVGGETEVGGVASK
jgi:hypothetical protein